MLKMSRLWIGGGIAALLMAGSASAQTGSCCSEAGKASAGEGVAVVAAALNVGEGEPPAACCADGTGACCAKGEGSVTPASLRTGPINATCPMSGNPISADAIASYKGKEIGFCCARCLGKFEAADEAGKEAMYQTVLASQPAAADPAVRVGDPYTLGTCAVAGGELGSMGDTIVKVVNGREVRFCCEMCAPKYEADPAKYAEKIDAAMIKHQMAFYPQETCVVAGTPLFKDGKDVGMSFIVNNRLVRTCCEDCAAKVKADPAPYLKKLDEAVIARQSNDYPLTNCLVMSEDELLEDYMTQMVVAHRLVRFCCKDCVKEFNANPAAYIAKLDKAWHEKKPEMFKRVEVQTVGG